MEVMRVSKMNAMRAACLLLAGVLAGCGLKGPLYLPEPASEIVTRPSQTPPDTTASPNSPQTVDSPAGGATPAPEVTAPQSVEDQAADEKKDADKKEKVTAPSPR